MSSPMISDTLRVGYWWSEKKSRKLNVKEFIRVCRNAGLDLVKIDIESPLEEQGPFVAIVHKFSDAVVKAEQGDPQSKAFVDSFQEYVAKHPEVIIIDPLPNVSKLLNRYKQYKLVEDSELQKRGIVFIPAFVELTTNDVDENVEKMKAAGVTFPCVCKPTLAHGTTAAHQMQLIFNKRGLKDINSPCVVQKFINHNAVLYKLFIIDNKYFMIERPSLKNFSAGDYETIFFDSHDISKPHSASALTELDDSEPRSPIVYPKKEKLDLIVQLLCQQLQLTLFGIDIIIDNATGDYAIIDMNIFPGYDEVDNFFQLVCDVIVNRISMQATGAPKPVFEPVLANRNWLSSSRVKSGCKKFTFDLESDCNEESMAVIPYLHKCYCCPISEMCNNVLPNLKHFRALNHKQLSISTELATVLQEKKSEKQTVEAVYTKVGDILKPCDYTQDDSGIETSDSCDERKKDPCFRTMKRQHSKSHSSIMLADV